MRIRTIAGTAAAFPGALLINKHAVSAEPATHQLSGRGARAHPGRRQADQRRLRCACRQCRRLGELHRAELQAQTRSQLHALIGEMMQGVDIMRGKDPQARREQVAEKIVAVLNTYPMHFNYPG